MHGSIVPPFKDERHCNNCTQFTHCYVGENAGIHLPPLFELKSMWDADRFGSHIQRCLGGICGQYIFKGEDKQWDK